VGGVQREETRKEIQKSHKKGGKVNIKVEGIKSTLSNAVDMLCKMRKASITSEELEMEVLKVGH
jgi:hypothetical protein